MGHDFHKYSEYMPSYFFGPIIWVEIITTRASQGIDIDRHYIFYIWSGIMSVQCPNLYPSNNQR